jgi:hypothetical protein
MRRSIVLVSSFLGAVAIWLMVWHLSTRFHATIGRLQRTRPDSPDGATPDTPDPPYSTLTLTDLKCVVDRYDPASDPSGYRVTGTGRNTSPDVLDFVEINVQVRSPDKNELIKEGLGQAIDAHIKPSQQFHINADLSISPGDMDAKYRAASLPVNLRFKLRVAQHYLDWESDYISCPSFIP